MNEKVFIKEIKKLKLDAGASYLFHIKEVVPQKGMDRLTKAWKKNFPDNKALFLSLDADMTIYEIVGDKNGRKKTVDRGRKSNR